MQAPPILWTPDDTLRQQSHMIHYLEWIHYQYNLSLKNYHDLWKWSVEHVALFWESIWKYYQVQSDTDYESILEMPDIGMIGTKWFSGARVNYAEHLFRNATEAHPAILFQAEHTALKAISWRELRDQVSKVAAFLRDNGVRIGDRVVSYMPNIPETLVAFLAAQSLGAIWSSCSPDFGAESVIERFQQIEPKVILAVDGYPYHGKHFSKIDVVNTLLTELKTLEQIIICKYTQGGSSTELSTQLPVTTWQTLMDRPASELEFEQVPFAHPMWVLYSSGTTGKPKAITHSVGGILLEHLKALGLHHNCQPGDRFFWYSTTGWMMWNYANAALLHGSTVVIYDGAATYPSTDALWKLAQEAEITHFGAGASFYIHCMREGLSFGENDFPKLQSIGSTGSPLIPEAFRWIYKGIKKNVWLISLSGGTDVCSGFVGGSPILPVYEGEIQCRMLGCAVEAYNESGVSVVEELGEMVITKPLPSMPIYFWGDEENMRYQSSYFEMYPGIWRHGDWIRITSRETLVIYGRSDATLNRGGVRIGTSEIYRAVEAIPQIKDSIVIDIDQKKGFSEMWLFVVLEEEIALDETLIQQIRKELRTRYSPRHIPDKIHSVGAVPYTISGKKMEAPIKKIFMGHEIDQSISKDAMKNPECLEEYVKLAGSKI